MFEAMQMSKRRELAMAMAWMVIGMDSRLNRISDIF